VDRDSAQHSLTLEIGDKVQFKVTKIAGVVVTVDRYPVLGPNSVFYKVKMANGAVWTAKPDDIEPLEE
jgi:hypothetical protein